MGGTLDMPLALEVGNMHIVKWWVNVSFAVQHPNMKSPIGVLMSLRKSAVTGSST
jgi:hypothetical protein